MEVSIGFQSIVYCSCLLQLFGVFGLLFVDLFAVDVLKARDVSSPQLSLVLACASAVYTIRRRHPDEVVLVTRLTTVIERIGETNEG